MADPSCDSDRVFLPSGSCMLLFTRKSLITGVIIMQFIGHELIIIVVGVVWGLGVGFAIAAGGTLCGEIANYL